MRLLPADIDGLFDVATPPAIPATDGPELIRCPAGHSMPWGGVCSTCGHIDDVPLNDCECESCVEKRCERDAEVIAEPGSHKGSCTCCGGSGGGPEPMACPRCR